MRIIEIDDLSRAKAEMKLLGADPAGIKIMAPKMVFRTLKIPALRSVAANILKQEMLSIGGEAALAYGAVNLSQKTTDVLLSGSLKHFSLLTKKLKAHAFGLPALADEIRLTLTHYDSPDATLPALLRKAMQAGAQRPTQIMGILNVTPDSFSDGGKFLDPKKAFEQAKKMVKAGADIIDIGGESTRPGARAVTAQEELKRVLPVIKLVKKLKVKISIDTSKAKVAEAALKAGANMINDITALRGDKKMAKVAAKYKVPVILMHIKGTPRTMQKDPEYQDLLGEIIEYLKESVRIGEKAGIERSKMILDPGFGFGKTAAHNLEILARLRELKSLGLPLLVGTSRKSTIGRILGLPADQRLLGTAATNAIAILNGADIIRVHDVQEMSQVAQMTQAISRRK